MRLGNNPLKAATVAPPARVVVLVITHLPEMESDYHCGRFDVLKHSVTSMIENIGVKDCDFIAWDNGSCQQVRDWLDGQFCKQFLSCNIGKTNALKSVMRMLPEGTILAYGDDDIEYFPGWLAPQIKILETFPNVGTVTGWPVRITGTWGVETAKQWEAVGTKLGTRLDGSFMEFERGRFIPDAWERDYCESIGADYDGYRSLTWGVQDFRITYRGVQAYAMSQHAQFVCYPERVEYLIPWTDAAMPNEIAFDRAVDAAGLLRLATVERVTRHMGNVLEERMQDVPSSQAYY
jgi:hypothetical protein